jgi:hypothetical protein
MFVYSQILRIANDTSSNCLYFRVFFKSSSMVIVFFKLKKFQITAMYLDNLDASAPIKNSGCRTDCIIYWTWVNDS